MAQRNSARALFAIGGFVHPAFVTLTRPSEGPWGLGTALAAFRSALLVWRRRVAVSSVVAGAVGGIEPHLDRARTLWAVHAHLVLDCRIADADLSPLAELWHELTARRGRLLIPLGGAPLRSPDHAAKYVTKADDWSPAPGALPPRALQVLFANVRGKRMFVAFGTGVRRCRG